MNSFKKKVVVRRLPPNLQEAVFINSLSKYKIAQINFKPGKLSTSPAKPSQFSRAYLIFEDLKSLQEFSKEYDGHIFLDSRGTEFRGLVEFASFQEFIIPKETDALSADYRMNTMESDPDYQEFIKTLKESYQNNMSTEQLYEILSQKQKELLPPTITKTTPLLEFLKQKRIVDNMNKPAKIASQPSNSKSKKKRPKRSKKQKDKERVTKEEKQTIVLDSTNFPLLKSESEKRQDEHESERKIKQEEFSKDSFKLKSLDHSRNQKPKTSRIEELQQPNKMILKPNIEEPKFATSKPANAPTNVIDPQTTSQSERAVGDLNIKDNVDLLGLKLNTKQFVPKSEISSTTKEFVPKSNVRELLAKSNTKEFVSKSNANKEITPKAHRGTKDFSNIKSFRSGAKEFVPKSEFAPKADSKEFTPKVKEVFQKAKDFAPEAKEFVPKNKALEKEFIPTPHAKEFVPGPSSVKEFVSRTNRSYRGDKKSFDPSKPVKDFVPNKESDTEKKGSRSKKFESES